MPGDSGHPTILIVHPNDEFHDILMRNLRQKGYLILEAQNATEAFEIVIRHSRSIHLLLADEGGDSLAMAEKLKPYRPDMKVIHIGSNRELSSVLMDVSKVLDPSHAHKDKEPTRTKGPLALAAEVDEPNQGKKPPK